MMSAAAADDGAERPIRALVEQMTSAYNRGGSAGVAAPFSANGIMIAGDGTRVATPAAIEAYIAKLITGLPNGARFEARVTDVRSLGADAAVLMSEGGFLMPGESKVTATRDGINAIVAVREAGTWRIALFQRTRRTVPKAAASPTLPVVSSPAAASAPDRGERHGWPELRQPSGRLQ
jgi:uncharacterized protein (TIGR02246 family)